MNVHAKKRECNEHRESEGVEMAFAQKKIREVY